MGLQKYNKGSMAVLATSIVGALSVFFELSQEFQAAVTTVITSVLVVMIGNKNET